MDLNEKHRAEREALQQHYMHQINSLKKQLENEEARLRSRHSEEIRLHKLKETAKFDECC